MSARLRSGNGTVLVSDDETVDENDGVTTETPVHRDSEIELCERGLSFGSAHLEARDFDSS